MKLKHRLEDIGDQLEELALAARAEKYQGVSMTFGAAQFSLSVPELLATFLDRGKYDLGKATLVVPDNVRARIEESPNEGRTRFTIWQGQPRLDAGRVVNLLVDIVGMQPTIPWLEINNDLSGGVIRLDPWKDLEFDLTY